jgi:hypothetical protein
MSVSEFNNSFVLALGLGHWALGFRDANIEQGPDGYRETINEFRSGKHATSKINIR